MDDLKAISKQGIYVHTYATSAEAERGEVRRLIGVPHISPDSVFVAGVGYQWVPGAWQRVADMVVKTQAAGYRVWLEEFPDSNVLPPYTEVGAMRDRAVRRAQLGGFDWLCLVENDALPEPDLLIRLVQRDVPIIVPRLKVKGNPNEYIGGPVYPENTGVQPMRWVAYTFIVARTNVFNCFGNALPFSAADPVEGTFGLQLWRYGHRLYQDNDNVLEIARGPSYAAADYDAYQERMKLADANRRRAPDRRSGETAVYMPWAVQNGHA